MERNENITLEPCLGGKHYELDNVDDDNRVRKK